MPYRGCVRSSPPAARGSFPSILRVISSPSNPPIPPPLWQTRRRSGTSSRPPASWPSWLTAPSFPARPAPRTPPWLAVCPVPLCLSPSIFRHFYPCIARSIPLCPIPANIFCDSVPRKSCCHTISFPFQRTIDFPGPQGTPSRSVRRHLWSGPSRSPTGAPSAAWGSQRASLSSSVRKSVGFAHPCTPFAFDHKISNNFHHVFPSFPPLKGWHMFSLIHEFTTKFVFLLHALPQIGVSTGQKGSSQFRSTPSPRRRLQWEVDAPRGAGSRRL